MKVALLQLCSENSAQCFLSLCTSSSGNLTYHWTISLIPNQHRNPSRFVCIPKRSAVMRKTHASRTTRRPSFHYRKIPFHCKKIAWFAEAPALFQVWIRVEWERTPPPPVPSPGRRAQQDEHHHRVASFLRNDLLKWTAWTTFTL